MKKSWLVPTWKCFLFLHNTDFLVARITYTILSKNCLYCLSPIMKDPYLDIPVSVPLNIEWTKELTEMKDVSSWNKC